jgi:hypothetical protein
MPKIKVMLWITIGILFCLGAIKYFNSSAFFVEVKISNKWNCDFEPKVIATCFYYPNRGGASGPNQIDSLEKKCPEIKFDIEKETLFICRGREMEKMKTKPLLKWRLDKSWTYGFPEFKNEEGKKKLFVYALESADIGFPQ